MSATSTADFNWLLLAGGFSGTAEAAYYLKNLQRRVAIPKGVTACGDGYTGIIMKQRVAVITTGVWPVFSSLKPLNDELKY
jgi:hypothetical protein